MPRQTQKRKKSRQWAQRHVSDTYVKQANQAGYRARAAFKLEEIDQKYKLIKPGHYIIDLGSAPGSWSQVAIKKIGPKGKVAAIDLLPMSPIQNVAFIHGDFCDQDARNQLLNRMEQQQADLILSDMAADLTGIRITDQANMENLLNSIIDSLSILLKPGGDLLVKVFEGELLHETRKRLNCLFHKVISIKPDASRKHSKEFYLLARQYKPQ